MAWWNRPQAEILPTPSVVTLSRVAMACAQQHIDHTVGVDRITVAFNSDEIVLTVHDHALTARLSLPLTHRTGDEGLDTLVLSNLNAETASLRCEYLPPRAGVPAGELSFSLTLPTGEGLTDAQISNAVSSSLRTLAMESPDLLNHYASMAAGASA